MYSSGVVVGKYDQTISTGIPAKTTEGVELTGSTSRKMEFHPGWSVKVCVTVAAPEQTEANATPQRNVTQTSFAEFHRPRKIREIWSDARSESRSVIPRDPRRI